VHRPTRWVAAGQASAAPRRRQGWVHGQSMRGMDRQPMLTSAPDAEIVVQMGGRDRPDSFAAWTPCRRAFPAGSETPNDFEPNFP
jgi:hypothetical protein